MAAVFLLLLSVAGSASALIPGVGYTLPPGARACWRSSGPVNTGQRCYLIDQSAMPYGPTGAGSIAVHDPTGDLFTRRWKGGNRDERGNPIGFCCELFGVNERTLRSMFEDGLLGSPAIFNGVPTTQESQDFAVTHSRSDPLYREHGQEAQGLGTTPEDPAEMRLPHPAGGWRHYYLDSATLGRIHYRWSRWSPGLPCYQPGYPEVLGACPGEPPPVDPEEEPPPPPLYEHEWLAQVTVADLIAARPAWILGALPVEDQEALLAAWLAFVDAHPESVGFRILREKYAP